MSFPDNKSQEPRVLPGYFSPAVPPVQPVPAPVQQQSAPPHLQPAPQYFQPAPVPQPLPPVPYYQAGPPRAYLQRDPASAPLPAASFVDALGQFFRKYGVFSGRAGRGEFWWMALAMAVLFLSGTLLGNVTGSAWLAGISVMAMLATIVPAIAVTVRRLHDVNLSGGLVFLWLVPYVGFLIVLVMAAMPANPAGSRYDRMLPAGHPHSR